MISKETRHPSNLRNGESCALNLGCAGARRRDSIVAISAKVRTEARPHLFCLTVVVLKTRRQSAMVALRVAATFLAMKVLPPSRTEGTLKLLVTPWVGARRLKNLQVGVVSAFC
ncbi:hypothetical protein [Mycolicibacterium gilvum]|uniref:hypothetical protein n=1 Tax=Mycolicibacterium gilvum TaxID=1804 RepID=UPI00404658C7